MSWLFNIFDLFYAPGYGSRGPLNPEPKYCKNVAVFHYKKKFYDLAEFYGFSGTVPNYAALTKYNTVVHVHKLWSAFSSCIWLHSTVIFTGSIVPMKSSICAMSLVTSFSGH